MKRTAKQIENKSVVINGKTYTRVYGLICEKVDSANFTHFLEVVEEIIGEDEWKYLNDNL